MKKPHVPWNSIRFKIFAVVLILTIPLIILLMYNNAYAIQVVRSQVSESNQKTISFYMDQFDEYLSDVDKYLGKLAGVDSDLYILEGRYSDKDYTLAKIRLSNKISEDILVYKVIDSIFIYTKYGDEFVLGIKGDETFTEREKIKSYIKELIQRDSYTGGSFTTRWYPEKLNGDYYLFRIIKSGDNYVGAWLKVERVLNSLRLDHLGNSEISLFTTEQGVPMIHSELITENKINLNHDFTTYYLSGEKDKYLVVGKGSNNGKFNLVALIPDKTILENLPYLKFINVIIFLGTLIILPFCLLLLKRILLNPLKNIVSAMKQIGHGNIDIRIQEHQTSDEFQLVNKTFNNMINQIKNLKISIYEEMLEKQKLELQHLQLQMNPHFYLNSLNIIYSLAQTNKNNLIKELSLSLVQHFHYMIKNKTSFVLIRDELEHIKNYLHIQELRYPNSFSYKINVDESLLECKVPTLLCQIFVENVIKHALTMDDKLHVLVDIEYDTTNPQNNMKIIIKDNGPGFRKEILTILQQGENISDQKEEHIGIWNVRRRLNLLYGNDAKITFYNERPTGAVVEIIIPFIPT